MTEYERNEEPISHGEPISGLPGWVKGVVGLAALLVLSASLFLIWKYLSAPNEFASPKELQLTNLIMFSFAVLILVLVPWQKLGIRIRKIGSVEFERVVSAQAKEHVEEFAELRARIEELEGKVRGLDEVAPLSENFTAQELRPLILKFLDEHQPLAYSPLRIYKWGARQPGFEEFGKYSQGAIRTVLQNLVLEGKASTRVSRLGNTLYTIVD